jgi:hypothetical protein
MRQREAAASPWTMAGVRLIAVLGVLAAAIAAAGCGGNGGASTAAAQGASSALPQGSETVHLNPADFTTRIDNPYWPMKAGSRWVYRSVDPEGLTAQRDVVKATNQTKKVDGVETLVVSDVASENGKPVEVTSDYYAQDKAGNIWYFGENTAEYSNGKVKSREGSFEAGVDGAQAGVALPANPKPGMKYRQEDYAGQAEDRGEVISTDAQAEPPFGHFTNALMTEDTSPLEPKVLEFKFYARGIGPATSVSVSGGSEFEELVSYKAG